MSTLYMPFLQRGQAGWSPAATDRDTAWRDEFIRIWLAWPGNLRTHMQPNAKLMAAAQAHAQELHQRQMSGGIEGSMHIGADGSTANERVRRAGYRLPDGYMDVGNQVESVGVCWEGPQRMMAIFATSPTHAAHLLGLHAWFAEQTCYGVGVSGDYFDVLTAHAEAD